MRKYYHNIPGLLLPKTFAHEQLHSDINRFIDTMPGLVETLEDSFENLTNEQDCFIKSMDMLLSLLADVYARSLEIEAELILRNVHGGARGAPTRHSFGALISGVITLSVEMQKAQNNENTQLEINEVEAHADMANNLSAIGKMIGGGSYEKAQSMIIELEESNPEAIIFKLLDLITSKKYDEAESIANVLKEMHSDAIKQFAGADSSKKILAVDDKPEIVSFVSSALIGHYKVVGVTGGLAALNALELHHPDLFILDIDMPKMDGYELAKKIRSNKNYENAPIIFLTGTSSKERITKAIEAGGNDFIVKPVSQATLLTKVGKYLSNDELAMYYRRLLERYERDDLTGLYGNNKFRAFLNELKTRVKSLGIIFFDVNDLKKVNDNQGHSVGSLLLKKAADSLILTVNEKIHPFRIGGDEFVVVMPDCTENEMESYLSNWREKLAELNAPDDGIRCAMAHGAAFGSGQFEASDLLQLADTRMYAEKRKMKAREDLL